MNLSKLYRVLVLGSSVLVASACGVDPAPNEGEAKQDPVKQPTLATIDPAQDAGQEPAIDAGSDAGPVVLADAGLVDAGGTDDAGGVNSWVSWI